MSPRAAITTIFLLNGAVFSSWYARLPAIQADLGLDPGAVGVALLGAPAGLLVAQPLVGGLVARTGSRPVLAALPVYVAAVVLPALAIDAATLFVATALVGAANGTLDIAMNVQGLAVERGSGRRIFNSQHAAFSFGALAGAGVAGVVAALGVSPLPHLIGAALAGATVAWTVSPYLLRDAPASRRPARVLARPTVHLAALGVIAFCALLAEGAVFDWSGIYLATEAGAPAGVAPLGLAAFALTMGIGRLTADKGVERAGAASVGAAGAVLAALGLGIALAVAAPFAALVGFALMGLGLSAVFPLALRASERPGSTAGPALAAVSTVGYGGFLLGPPLIGIIADGTDLRAALVVVIAMCLLAAGLASHLREEAPRTARLPRLSRP
jgi:MFS family permease